MQIVRLSLTTSLLLATLHAEDYIQVQFLQYNENNERASISAPALEVSKDFGTDYTVIGTYNLDSISGASPTFYDAQSGASAYSRGLTTQENIRFGGIEYNEPKRMSGAIKGIKRFDNRDELTLSGSFSNEYDYRSSEIALEVLHWVDSYKNQSVNAGIAFQKNVILVECRENSICDGSSGASKKLRADAFLAEVGLTQVIDINSKLQLSLFYKNEDGYLSNPFMNVIRNYNTAPTITNETRPEHRRGYGAILTYTKSLREDIAWHSSYRYYHDNWQINSHTLNNTLYYAFNDKLTLSSGVRYYLQDAAYFFSQDVDHFTDEAFASSDARLGDFHAINFMLGTEYKLRNDIIYNINVNIYDQNNGTTARYVTTGLKYLF